VTITWGDITFEGPYSITSWEPPYRAAVYAIMMKPDPEKKPRTYRIIYFGESSNLSERGFYRAHHKYECFIKEAGSEANLYIGIYLMPDSTEEERREVEQRLINQYKPACNE
jgi:hypothetical protein